MTVRPDINQVSGTIGAGPGGRQYAVAKAVAPLLPAAVNKLADVLNSRTASDSATVEAAFATLKLFALGTGTKKKLPGGRRSINGQ